MIVSLVSEDVWCHALGSLPVWTPPLASMLIVAPHPDDETLGAGGLIAAQRMRGVDVQIAAVTDGENAYVDDGGLAQIRRKEQDNAIEALGVPNQNTVRFGLPDSDAASCEAKLVEQLSKLVSSHTHLVAPWRGDFHPDHQACGRAAEQVARATGATLTSYFFWTWHFAAPANLQALSLYRFPLAPDVLCAKTKALTCHRSQLEHRSGEPILPESLLGPARRNFEIFAIA